MYYLISQRMRVYVARSSSWTSCFATEAILFNIRPTFWVGISLAGTRPRCAPSRRSTRPFRSSVFPSTGPMVSGWSTMTNFLRYFDEETNKKNRSVFLRKQNLWLNINYGKFPEYHWWLKSIFMKQCKVQKDSHTGSWTRACWVKASYPSR